MDSYIVRQALMDSNQKTFGYEILYADSSFAETQTDDSTAAMHDAASPSLSGRTFFLR